MNYSKMRTILKDHERVPLVIDSTKKLLDDCDLQFDRESLKNKKIYSASRYDDKLLLEKLAWDEWHTGTAGKTMKQRKGLSMN